jgi:hypothetical protein
LGQCFRGAGVEAWPQFLETAQPAPLLAINLETPVKMLLCSGFFIALIGPSVFLHLYVAREPADLVVAFSTSIKIYNMFTQIFTFLKLINTLFLHISNISRRVYIDDSMAAAQWRLQKIDPRYTFIVKKFSTQYMN